MDSHSNLAWARFRKEFACGCQHAREDFIVSETGSAEDLDELRLRDDDVAVRFAREFLPRFGQLATNLAYAAVAHFELAGGVGGPVAEGEELGDASMATRKRLKP